ncbi:MAG: hypothetical protein HWD58_10695 [Bacteroidota bacterium]|nr:MAG: hypothetical protein HWD58_10695 [Bacteroidota bacterium]
MFQSFQPLAFHSFRDSLLIQVSGIDSSQMYVMQSDGLQPFKKIKLASTQSILVGFIEQDTYILCTFEPGNQTTFCWYKNSVLIKRINACHMTNQTMHSFVTKLPQGLTQVLRFDGSPIGNINLSEIKIPGSYIEAATLGALFFPDNRP